MRYPWQPHFNSEAVRSRSSGETPTLLRHEDDEPLVFVQRQLDIVQSVLRQEVICLFGRTFSSCLCPCFSWW